MTSPQPPAHRPRKGGRWPLQRPTLPPGVSDGRGWVTVNKPTRPDRDPARLISRRARALRFTLTRHISSMCCLKECQDGFLRPTRHENEQSLGSLSTFVLLRVAHPPRGFEALARSGAVVCEGNVTASTMMAQVMSLCGRPAPVSCSRQHSAGVARPMLRPYRAAPGFSTQHRCLTTEPVLCAAYSGAAPHAQARRQRRRQARGSLGCRNVTAQPPQPEEVQTTVIHCLQDTARSAAGVRSRLPLANVEGLILSFDVDASVR